MRKTNNIFDCLENAEGIEMERINNKTPKLDDKQLERILELSERKYNIKKRNNINTAINDTNFNDGYTDEAEGVEIYNKRNIWLKVAAAAAAVVLTGGIIGITRSILKGGRTVSPSQPDIAFTTVITTNITTDNSESSNSTSVSDGMAAAGTDSSSTETTSTTTVQSDAAQNNTTTAPDSSSNEQQPESTTYVPSQEVIDQCYEIIKMQKDYYITYSELIQVPISDFLDFSDSFTVSAHADHGVGDDNPVDFTIKFVRYNDPKFVSLNEIREFTHHYIDCFCGGVGVNEDKMFGQTITPESTITNERYIPEEFFVYTEYNGKIYRGVDINLKPYNTVSHDEYYAHEYQSVSWGEDYLKNVTDNSFEDYRVDLNRWDGTYYGRYRYYYYDGTNWRSDTSKERELSDAECRAAMQ